MKKVAAAAAGAALMTWAVRGRSSQVFGPSVWRGEAGRRALALTFDDGPSPATLDLLELLERHGARATFFQCGINAERAPEIARAVFQAGHEIGNHGYLHQMYALRSAEFIARDLGRAQRVLRDAAGVEPRLMRAPFGARWFGMREIQRRMRLLHVMWTVIGLDWKLPGAAVAERVLRAAAPGAIVCLHDGRGTALSPDIRETLEAVRILLPRLRERGYILETASEILCPPKSPSASSTS